MLSYVVDWLSGMSPDLDGYAAADSPDVSDDSDEDVFSSGPSLPADCIGAIMYYNASISTLLNVICASRYVRNYLTITNPDCCRHVEFKLALNFEMKDCAKWEMKLRRFKGRQRYPFIVNMRLVPVEHARTCRHLGFLGNGCALFAAFPHLKVLNMRKTQLLDDMFEHFPQLESLHVASCSMGGGETQRVNFTNGFFRSLKHFKVISMHNSHGPPFGTTLLTTLCANLPESVESVLLCDNHCMTSENPFAGRVYVKVRVLKLSFSRKFKGSVFRSFPEVEEVCMTDCDAVRASEFKFLPKLKKLTVRRCIQADENCTLAFIIPQGCVIHFN